MLGWLTRREISATAPSERRLRERQAGGFFHVCFLWIIPAHPGARMCRVRRNKWSHAHAWGGGRLHRPAQARCRRTSVRSSAGPAPRTRAAGVGVSTAKASGKVRIPPIRGRADELKVMGALIAAVAQGRGGVLVIEGPPGIGKSRLLTEVLALAEKAGVRALFGEAFEYQQAVPFFSLFMATLRADPPVGDAEALRRLGTSADVRYWVVRDLQAAIHAAASRTPLAILLEDIHWAETPPCWRCGRWPRRGPMSRCCGCLPREPAPADRPFARR